MTSSEYKQPETDALRQPPHRIGTNCVPRWMLQTFLTEQVSGSALGLQQPGKVCAASYLGFLGVNLPALTEKPGDGSGVGLCR